MKLKCILAAVLTLAVMAASGCTANENVASGVSQEQSAPQNTSSTQEQGAPQDASSTQEQSAPHEHSFNNGKCECGVSQCDIEGHKMSEATCTKPATCSVCGMTRGSTTSHKPTGGSCDEAPKCSVCGKAVGSPLGHSCDIGRCSKCGTVVKNNDVQNMIDYFNRAVDELNWAIDYFNIAYSNKDMDDVQNRIEKAASYLKKMYDISKKYDSSHTLTSTLDWALGSYPTVHFGTSAAAKKTYAGKIEAFKSNFARIKEELEKLT